MFTILQVLRIRFGKAKFGDSWIAICQACEHNFQQKDSTIVKWIRPQMNTIKLNSDGSCLNGKCGGGGIVRDYNGRVIFAYAIPLERGTSNLAEAAALLFMDCHCALGMDSIQFVGETDSLLIANCINKQWKITWMISDLIENIQTIVEDKEFLITHCYREANKPADKLASLRHESDLIQIFNSHPEIPTSVKGLINMDRWNIPTFRIKNVKDRNIIFDPT
ncbi:uncharacterized protein LOC132040553 [Lycium ferocissimum]|uniref:uncharacterized protein LOC132040553 n=1 Tax=Lycium ferocissimum TaxID=112874 RepID=UPI0028165CDE|nr:uncharacterized protein LOC132040553 [Lycium ferocissimum]